MNKNVTFILRDEKLNSNDPDDVSKPVAYDSTILFNVNAVDIISIDEYSFIITIYNNVKKVSAEINFTEDNEQIKTIHSITNQLLSIGKFNNVENIIITITRKLELENREQCIFEFDITLDDFAQIEKFNTNKLNNKSFFKTI